jgi:hypothetical protein
VAVAACFSYSRPAAIIPPGLLIPRSQVRSLSGPSEKSLETSSLPAGLPTYLVVCRYGFSTADPHTGKAFCAASERADPASAGTARLRSGAHRYGVYRYFLIAGLLTFARVMIAEPVP